MADALATPEIDIDLIDVVDEFNARKKFPKDELEELAGTIEETGLVQPIRVRQKADGRFDLVAGKRRFRAAKLAGRTKIEITLSTGNPFTESLIENIHRAKLNPIETAARHNDGPAGRFADRPVPMWLGALPGHVRVLDWRDLRDLHRSSPPLVEARWEAR